MGKRLCRPAALALLAVLAAGSPGRSASAEDRAAAEVKRLGGKVERDTKAPGKPVVVVRLGFTRVSDAELALLKGFTQLRELALGGSNVSDAGLAHLKGLTQLRELGLSRTRVSDAGLAQLKGLTNLQLLGLARTTVTDKGVAELKKALPKVSVLR